MSSKSSLIFQIMRFPVECTLTNRVASNGSNLRSSTAEAVATERTFASESVQVQISMEPSVGQNPTLQEISELQETAPSELTFDNFAKIVNREGGFKKAGQPEDYIKAFQIFDKNLTGFIGVGELKYILTSVGEKLNESEVDELLKGVNVTDEQTVDYVEFVKSILAQ
ncbi:hypothetical protein OGAPHI_001632 [Ogataea philodendri]|uniref:EF-hand domain-containing protein n=1 Tax=Ogataea philodendri TaxID=1378263 RepID=A0A9P8T848_9ASCO|nr:uncharacterized protein OGAPHI_001632 [Ogataea philodendri]KAH3669511.1 hypothetical protein OGAPHI_001632 [Ogataea philodendri]